MAPSRARLRAGGPSSIEVTRPDGTTMKTRGDAIAVDADENGNVTNAYIQEYKSSEAASLIRMVLCDPQVGPAVQWETCGLGAVGHGCC